MRRNQTGRHPSELEEEEDMEKEERQESEGALVFETVLKLGKLQ